MGCLFVICAEMLSTIKLVEQLSGKYVPQVVTSFQRGEFRLRTQL
jgi:hypothetical protein